jgi:hypothetical protein
MTLAEQDNLAAFQQDVAGSMSFCLSSAGDPGAPMEDEVESEAENGDVDGWVDEEAVLEGLGVRSCSSEWANRLAAEHEAWMEQLPSLCDAYLAFRSGVELPECSGRDTHSVSLRCIHIDSEYGS